MPAYGVHDGATIRVCSEELASMFGAVSAADVVGSDILAFIAPEARDQAIAAVLSAAPGCYTSIGLRPDGHRFPIQVGSTPIRHRHGGARLFTVRDLSPIALVVDDEETVVKMTASLLRMSGFQVAAYTNARQAVAAYYPGGASVVVSDVLMPELDGIAMVRLLREQEPGLPVIFISGYSQEPVREDSVTAFVKKPFGIAALTRALESLPARAREPLE